MKELIERARSIACDSEDKAVIESLIVEKVKWHKALEEIDRLNSLNIPADAKNAAVIERLSAEVSEWKAKTLNHYLCITNQNAELAALRAEVDRQVNELAELQTQMRNENDALRAQLEAAQQDIKAAWTTNRAIDKARMEDREKYEAAQKQEPVEHQYQDRDGTWHTFINDTHRLNTIDDGSWPVRELYAAPIPAAPIPVDHSAEVTPFEEWNAASNRRDDGSYRIASPITREENNERKRKTMNATEHTMVCGAEEAGEIATAALAVAKALHKGLRFGQYDINPERQATAVEVLAAELNDLTAVVEMLQEAGVLLPGLHDRTAIDAKKRKVRSWMEYAETRGSMSSDAEGKRP